MSKIHEFIMKKGISSRTTTFLLGFFFFLFIIIFHPTLSHAVEQGSLFIQTNAPGANVYLDDNQIGKTDQKGGFLIDDIPREHIKSLLKWQVTRRPREPLD